MTDSTLAQIRALSAAADPVELRARITQITGSPETGASVSEINPKTTGSLDAPANIPVEAETVAPYLATKAPIYIDLFHDDRKMEVIRAYIGGRQTGLYERSELRDPVIIQNPDGTQTIHIWSEKRIIPWVAIRVRAYSEVVIKDGAFEETGNPFYDVLVLSPAGQKIIKRMPAEDAANITKVLNAASELGLTEPQVYDTTHVRNMLRVLGATDCKVETEVLVGGWVDTARGATFIEPLGTTSESGISQDYRVTVEGADRYMGTTGISIANANKTLDAWFKIMPGRRDLAIAGLSAVMAAVLGMKRRTTLYIAAQHGSGKSVYFTCLMPWSNDVRRKGEMSMTLESSKTASIPALYARMSIICGMTYFDDLLYSDPTAFERIDAIARAGYQSSARSMSETTGRERVQVYGGTQAISVVSAEAIPESPHTRSTIERMVTVQMRKGDLMWKDIDGAQNPVDVWKGDFAEAANHLRGAFIQWLAAKANALGSVTALHEWADSIRENNRMALSAGDMNREADVVSVLSAGWDAFSQFLTESGIELPISEAEVEAAFKMLLTNAQERGSQANPVLRMLEHVRDSVSSGYFTSIADDVPGGVLTGDVHHNPGALGWRRDGDGRWVTKGHQHFGYVSDDGKYALILAAGMKWAKSYDATRSLPLNSDQLSVGLDDLIKEGVVIDHTYGGRDRKVPLPLGFGGGKRGVVVPLGWLVGAPS